MNNQVDQMASWWNEKLAKCFGTIFSFLFPALSLKFGAKTEPDIWGNTT